MNTIELLQAYTKANDAEWASRDEKLRIESLLTDEIEYWRHFLARTRFPREGIFFLVPDDCGPRSHVLVSAEEPRRKLPVMLSGDDTPESCAAMFTAALTVPGLRPAEVLLSNADVSRAPRTEKP